MARVCPLEATYNKVLDSPNTVGRYSLEAPDISVRYPSPGQFADWTLAVSVVSNFPLPRDNRSDSEWEDLTFTASRVRLTPPAGLDVDASWEMCVMNWDINLETYPTQLRTDDGNCTSLLSEECIRDMEQSVVFGRCSCPNLREIESCGDEQADLMDSIGPGCFAKRKTVFLLLFSSPACSSSRPPFTFQLITPPSLQQNHH